jgi:hypothetical protein
MPGGFPLLGDVCNAQAAGINTAATLPSLVTASSTNNTKGSWSQLIAATSADCVMMEVVAYFSGGSYGSNLVNASVDIGIGGAGSEVVVIPDLVISPSYISIQLVRILVPICIPAGTRVSARAQVDIGSAVTAVYVSATLFDGDFSVGEGAAGVTAIGFNSAATKGTPVTPSATAHTKGAYAQLTASTPRDFYGFFVIFNLTYGELCFSLFDIAIGASGSEFNIIPNRFVLQGDLANNAGSFTDPVSPFIPMRIPSGTRISARAQSSKASAQPVGVTLYGVW